MRRLRQILAIVLLLISTLYISGVSGFLPEAINPKFIVDLQLIPALLSGTIAALVIIALLTVLLGRLYCSVICPLGVVQDLMIRLSNWVKKKRKIKRSKEFYKKPNNILRYSILVLTVLSIVIGSSYLVLLIDPYSIYGRFCNTLLSPSLTFINNTLAYIGNLFNNYTFDLKEYHLPSLSVVVSVIIISSTIIYLNIKHGRLWCNTVCPVGTLLGLVSRYSIFKVWIDNSKCIDCKACARVCKANVIDNTNAYKVDYSRCISCYNCIDACKKDALKLSFTTKMAGNDNV